MNPKEPRSIKATIAKEKSTSGTENTKQPSLDEEKVPNKSVLGNYLPGSSEQSSEAATKMDKRGLPKGKESLLETTIKNMLPTPSEPSTQTTPTTPTENQLKGGDGQEAMEVEHQEEESTPAPAFKYILRSDNQESLQALNDKAAKFHAKRAGARENASLTTQDAPDQSGTKKEPKSDPVVSRSIVLGTTKTSKALDSPVPTKSGLQQARAAARALQEKSKQNSGGANNSNFLESVKRRDESNRALQENSEHKSGGTNNSNFLESVKRRESIAQQRGAVAVASSFHSGGNPRTTHRTMDQNLAPGLSGSLEVVEQQAPLESLHNVTEATLVDPKERIVEENRIRQDTINEIKATAAQAEVVDPLAERKRRINVFLFLVCLMGVLITVAVTVTVALLNNDNDTAVVVFPTRAELVQHAVRQEFGSDSLDDETSPQYVAVDWMAVNDTLLEFPLETEAERRAFRQRYSMCVLAFATGIETWVRQKNWLEPVDECTWSGLTCNGNKEIVAINTPNRNLTGTLPTELGSLPQLRFMFVYDNPGLEGSLPDQLGNATSLELLYAQDCSLTGTLPDEFRGLTSLERLVLARNQLSGKLPVEMTQMINMEELDLSQNNFTGVILPKFWHLQRLQVLLLNDNTFTGTLSPNFGDLALLQRFEIHNNFLSGNLPTQLGNLRALHSFRTFGNSINASAVPDELCNLRRDAPHNGLQVLELDCSQTCRCCTPCSGLP